jgi:hypothetical protein
MRAVVRAAVCGSAAMSGSAAFWQCAALRQCAAVCGSPVCRKGQPLDPQGRHNGDILTTQRHRRAEDNWDMRVDDPLCVALAPAALQM